MKQTGSGASLRRAGNFAPVHHDICAHRIRETIIVAAVCDRRIYLDPTVTDRRYSCQFWAVRTQSIAQSAMNFLVDGHRRFAESRIVRGNDDRISQIVSVRINSTAGPTPDQIAPRRIICDIGKSSKITERKRSMTPPVKTNRRNLRPFEQTFVNRHVHRRATRRIIVVIDIECGKDRHRRSMPQFRLEFSKWRHVDLDLS